MIDALAPRLVYTAAFAFCAVWCVREVVTHRGALHRVGHALHLLMAVAMAVMVWPVGMRAVPLLPQIVLFGVATAWFVVMLVVALVRHRPGAPTALSHVPHAIMMAAMTWHLRTMAARHTAVAHAGHMGSAGHPMPAPMGQLWQVAGLVLFAALTVWGVVSAIQVATRRGARGAHLNQAVMSLAMVALTIPMLTAGSMG